MVTAEEFQEIIRKKGLDAAEKKRDEQKSTVLKKAGLKPDEFQRLLNELDRIDGAFNRAFHLLRVAGSVSASGGTQKKWVIDTLKNNNGKMYGPALYDEWERTGGNRRAIQTVVSNLISDGKLIKGKWEVRDRQRGSHLSIPSQENEQG